MHWFKKFFYGKRKKQLFFFTTFYISYKSGIKTFLNNPLTNALKIPVNKILIYILY